MIVPSASDNGKLRLGFFPSAAGKVMLFHASAAKSEPTIATATRVIVPIIQVPSPGGYGCMVDRPAFRQKFVKFAWRAAAVENITPRTTSAARAPVFVTVKTFCTI